MMIVEVVIGLPLALVSPGPATLKPSTLALLGLAGICYVVGLQLTYAALRIGKVSIVAPIDAGEGAVAALIAVAIGDQIGIIAGIMLAVRRRHRPDRLHCRLGSREGSVFSAAAVDQQTLGCSGSRSL